MHAMAMNLSEGEEVVLDLHPHWARLFLPVLILLVACLLAGFGVALIPKGGGQQIERWIVIAIAAIVIIWRTILPYLRWLTTKYVLTTDRLVIRHGILARHGRDIPLNRINDVSFSETVFERMLRSGTLVVESAGDNGQISLTDVPRVEHVQREVYRMVDQNLGKSGGTSMADGGRVARGGAAGTPAAADEAPGQA
jgi:uncharacterized membrane protein YdbT with pleckstrin-like domain